MARKEHRTTPKVVSGVLYSDDSFTGTRIGSDQWLQWLDNAKSFYYESPAGVGITVRCETRQRGGVYWFAYKQTNNVLRRKYVGKADKLTIERLNQVASELSSPQPVK